jgi:hypothetical protein
MRIRDAHLLKQKIKEVIMAVKISPAQIQNLQQIEAVVAGPEDANRLFIIDGQFDSEPSLDAASQGHFVSHKEIFTVLIGPVFTRTQFFQANATASLTKTNLATTSKSEGVVESATWQILGADADWDDESGQVELRIEAEVTCWGQGNHASINGFGFHVTILAAVPAA